MRYRGLLYLFKESVFPGFMERALSRYLSELIGLPLMSVSMRLLSRITITNEGKKTSKLESSSLVESTTRMDVLIPSKNVYLLRNISIHLSENQAYLNSVTTPTVHVPLLLLLSCQPRVTVTSCFVYKVIRVL